MRNRLIFAVLLLILAVLAFSILQRKYFNVQEKNTTAARVVIPQVSGHEDDEYNTDATGYGDTVATSLIELNGEETLIDTLDMDFDGDGLNDQVNAIKSVVSPYISLLVGLCNPQTGVYERTAVIATPVQQVKTFSYMGLDLVGDHSTALVYQGFLENGNSVLQAFFVNRAADGSALIKQIANYESDGTIFIQQTERSSAYTLSNEQGEPYSIWVYSFDSASNDHIHTRYAWSNSASHYVQAEQIRVAGSSVAARELSRIQDGTVETFATFLNGLWYKTENYGEGLNYIFFDYESRQIIFLKDDEEAVYNWQTSSVRRNGMYVSTTNLEIENLQRRVDISLRSTDEISVSVHDDVSLVITEDSHWNGSYKKLNYTTVFTSGDEEKENRFEKVLEEGPQWKLPDGSVVSFSDGMYAAWGDTSSEEGRFTELVRGGKNFLQFRSNGNEKNPVFSKMYAVTFADSADNPENVDTDSIILEPYVLTPSSGYAVQGRVIVLSRYNPDDALALLTDTEEEALSLEFTSTGDGPKVSVDSSANPYANRFFSPDGDGNEDVLSMTLECETSDKIQSWELVVRDSRNGSVFWRTGGTSMQAVQGKPNTYSASIRWDGKGTAGALVTSAEDYPYEFTVTDTKGLTSTYKSIIPVDVLIVREGGRLKMQVPSIVFRSDAADFKLVGETDDYGNVIERSSITREQQTNNERVLLRIAQILNKFSTYRVTIVGHANPTNQYDGPEENNPEENRDGVWGRALIPLSRERAQYVKNWLVTQGGIAAGRLSVEGKGGLETIVNKNDLVRRWQNRRVEFILER